MSRTHFPGNPYADHLVGLPHEVAATRNALLALAFEQRTANLIALHLHEAGEPYLHRRITGRLGLTGDEAPQ